MTKRLEFDAAHRLVNHESKCANLHGHRYAVEIEILLTGTLDSAGRIVDFGVVKNVFGEWVDRNLDHACVVNTEDAALVDYLVHTGQKFYLVDCDPSAENLAGYLLSTAAHLLDAPGRRVSRLTLWETPTSRAEVTR